jgi:hypothetical protein
MNKTLKISIGVLIIVIIESLSYKWFERIDLESFFALWALLFILLLISSIFGLFGKSYSGKNIIGGTVKGAPIGSVHITDDMIKPPKKKVNTGGLFKTINLVYLILIMMNLIGYFIFKV